MLKIDNQAYFDEVVAFAKATGRETQLKDKLEYLEKYGDGDNQCIIWKDFAPASFNFVMQRPNPDGTFTNWFNGGLIFHGNHDGFGSGAAPTFSVCVSPTDGWSIHT